MADVASVFGDDSHERKVPDDIVERLKELVDELHLDKDQVKVHYVSDLEKVDRAYKNQAGDRRWAIALAGTRAWYNSLSYSAGKSYPVKFVPFSLSGKPFKDEKKGTWSVRAFGLALAEDEDYKIRGPLDVQCTGFLTEEVAKQSIIDQVKLGQPYLIHANPSTKAPSGDLRPGQSGFVFVDASSPWESFVPGAGDIFILGGYDTLSGYYPETKLNEILTTPKANTLYHIEANVVRTRTGLGQNNQQNGSMTLADETVAGELAKAAKGGLFIFLPSEYVHLASLSAGSRVSALINGYESNKKDSSGNNTGEVQWRWNVLGMKVLIDLSGGTTIPNPEQPAVKIPTSINGLRPKQSDF